VQSSVSSSGVVTEVAFQNGLPVLMIGSMVVPISQVSQVGTAPPD
jgi:hypothetical protein